MRASASRSGYETPRRILVRGVNWLGDAVMTTPALLRLREAHPAAHISLLSPDKLADLWLHHPAVDAVLVSTAAETVWSIGRQLRSGGFDTGLVLPNSPRSALELWWGRIPRRIGYAAHWRRWWLTEALPAGSAMAPMRKRSNREIRRLSQGPSPGGVGGKVVEVRLPPAAHHVHHYLRLATALGARPEPLPPRIVVSELELEQAARRLELPSPGADTAPLLGLNAGAEYGPAKRWPWERFARAAVELRRQTGCVWVLFGGPGDVELAGRIAGEIASHAGPGPPPVAGSRRSPAPPVINLAGRTTLRELCAGLKACRAVLTNDTGPMHLAAAVGTPVVVPFGSTAPELTGPGLPEDPRHRLLRSYAPCAPCFRRVCPIDFRCMTGIGVDQVVAAVLEVLAAHRPEPA